MGDRWPKGRAPLRFQHQPVAADENEEENEFTLGLLLLWSTDAGPCSATDFVRFVTKNQKSFWRREIRIHAQAVSWLDSHLPGGRDATLNHEFTVQR